MGKSALVFDIQKEIDRCRSQYKLGFRVVLAEEIANFIATRYEDPQLELDRLRENNEFLERQSEQTEKKLRTLEDDRNSLLGENLKLRQKLKKIKEFLGEEEDQRNGL